MKASKYLWLVLVSTVPALAQVERVAICTTGISCGTCAVVSEFHLRRMAGIGQVRISRSQEAVMLTYKPGPLSRRKLSGTCLRPSMSAWYSGKSFFLAGKDKFLLLAAAWASVPFDTPILIEGILNDQSNPVELKVLELYAGEIVPEAGGQESF